MQNSNTPIVVADASTTLRRIAEKLRFVADLADPAAPVPQGGPADLAPDGCDYSTLQKRYLAVESGRLLRFLAGEPITGREYDMLRDGEVTNFLGGHHLEPLAAGSPDAAVVRWRFEADIIDGRVDVATNAHGQGPRGHTPNAESATKRGLLDGARRRLHLIADKLQVIKQVISLLENAGLIDSVGDLDRKVLAESAILLRYLAGEPITGREYDALRDARVIDSLGGYHLESLADRSQDEAVVAWQFEATVDSRLAAALGLLDAFMPLHLSTPAPHKHQADLDLFASGRRLLDGTTYAGMP